jgi:hypothetical protein
MDTTRQGYLGLTGHWIDVMDSGKWVLRSEVVGFWALSGDHSGDNLAVTVLGCVTDLVLQGKSIPRYAAPLYAASPSIFSNHTGIDVSCILQHLIIPQAMEHSARPLKLSTYIVNSQNGLQTRTSFRVSNHALTLNNCPSSFFFQMP